MLFVSLRYPHPALRGDQRRVLELLRVLRHQGDVRLLTFGQGPPLPFEGVEVRAVARSALGALRANLGALDPRLPAQIRVFLDHAMRLAVRQELRSFRPDVVHATLARSASYLPGPGSWHRHLDLVDSLSLNMTRRAAASARPMRLALAAEARLLAGYEARAVAAADSASVVAEADRDRALGLQRCEVIPNGVDLASFAYCDPVSRPAVMIFPGNLGYFPAFEATRFLAQDVLPLVRAQQPDAELWLVGARPSSAVRALGRSEGVVIVGRVERMADALHGAAVAAVPMFSGSGMKNKVVEAMATGTPVVTNAVGIDGIEAARPGVDHLQAETAEAFAEACLRLLRDPDERTRLARAGRRLVERHHTWEAAAEQLLALYGR